MNDAEISSISSQPLKIGLISISDRASQGVYQDLGLPALKEWFARALVSPFTVCEKLIADDRATITATIIDLVDNQKCDLVITTGGTGPSRRDVTPEATLAAATREMPGFGEQMRQISLKFVPTAILSRQTAVLRETDDHAALVMNLPGQPKAIAQTLEGLRSETGEVMTPGI
ncbi:MAG: molybdopterin adenylyltransferase, partial [Burkholderiaceae bacterium]|nr:molybdopterin adenylyltransferase [Burkholderiaceae bacterium]